MKIDMRRLGIGRPHWAGPAFAVAVGVASIWVLYRDYFTSGLNAMRGPLSDGRLVALIAAHWAHPVQFGSWTNLGFFHPASDTLGYSDALLAFGLIGAPLNLVGLDAQQTLQVVLILLTTLGYVSLVSFLRISVRSPWWLASLTGFLFTCSNGFTIASEHTQFMSIALVPLLLLLALLAFRQQRRRMRALYGLALGTTFGILLTTAFYIAWFTAFGLAAIAILFTLASLLRSGTSRRQLARFVWQGRSSTLWAAIGVIPFLVIFARIYGPVAHLGGTQRSDVGQEVYTLWPRDFLNMGTGNLLWGWLAERVADPAFAWRFESSEWSLAPTPLLVTTSAIVAFVCVVRLRRLGPWTTFGAVTLMTGLLMSILPVQLPGLLPWTLLRWLPGAFAMRSIARMELLAAAFLVIGLALVFSTYIERSPRQRTTTAFVAVLLTILCLEQLNLATATTYTRSEQAGLGRIPHPPAECQVFAVVAPAGRPLDRWHASVDAMVLSQRLGIPTINGYSGLEPDDWGLTRPGTLDYAVALRNWIAHHGEANVTCGIDLEAHIWQSPSTLQRTLMGVTR